MAYNVMLILSKGQVYTKEERAAKTALLQKREESRVYLSESETPDLH